MTDNSEFLSQGKVGSSVQSTNRRHPDRHEPDRHEIPSLDRKSSISSLLDELQHTFSGDFGSFGSMNVDELLENVLTEEEIQAYEQTLLPNPSIALRAAAPMGAATATANISPQFPEGEIETSTMNDTAIPQCLQRQDSLTLPSPLSQKTVNEVWYEMPKFQQEQEHGSTSNVQEVDSAHRQTTYGDMTFEEFLIMAGVVQAHDHSPPPLQQSSVSYQKDNNTVHGSGTPDCMVRPVIASGGGGNVPAYQALPERSVKDAVARIPSGYQPREVGYGGKMQNNTSEGGFGQGSPASPVSSDSVGENQSDSVNNLHSGPVEEKVVSRKQRRMIKNRESAARSRARRQAYNRELEARLHMLEEENARLKQDRQATRRTKQQNLVQYMEEAMRARKARDEKKGIKRSWSSLF
ncbi:hypothetical protein POM88_031955 [Heracleum sosnowskyi]|uniref:BZIP domain-containing protein n=1 Tax=Heracleum sosnowskyi TaxID=360622 RepID=A0AAD8I0D3_9APIA|nr:hypothetical protein POM88_031955 [Heracleum sosnowskyi]